MRQLKVNNSLKLKQLSEVLSLETGQRAARVTSKYAFQRRFSAYGYD